jgi:hypothetical protein
MPAVSLIAQLAVVKLGSGTTSAKFLIDISGSDRSGLLCEHNSYLIYRAAYNA